jgi:hypothetical protein
MYYLCQRLVIVQDAVSYGFDSAVMYKKEFVHVLHNRQPYPFTLL